LSRDGKKWEVVFRLRGGYDFGRTSYLNGVYFAHVTSLLTGDLLLTSTDNGLTWNSVPNSVPPITPDTANNHFVILGPK